MTFKVFALGLSMLLLTAGTTSANNSKPFFPQTTHVQKSNTQLSYSFSLGTELMAGDTTYQIGYPITGPYGDIDGYFPFSELEWPLDIWLARIDGSILIKDTWRINATLKKNISDPNDDMADSDWLTDNPDQLDVYSESTISSFDAFIVDVDVDWIFVKLDTISFYAGLGLLYQNFEYEGILQNQYSPSGLTGYNVEGNGEVGITYEMTYTIPYVKVGTDFQITSQFALAGSFSFSPLVEAEDTDHHLQRENGGKISTGDMDGNAFMFDVSAKYMFTPAFFVKTGIQYLKIDVDGTQNQAWGNGIQGFSVAEESESTQTTGFILIGYQF